MEVGHCVTQLRDAGGSVVMEVNDLGFSYGGAPPIFSGINLKVTAGQSVAITGPSGTGKSTLLQLVSGLLSPTVGEVRLNGERFSTLSAARRADIRLRRLGLVFQFGELVPELSVSENVELASLFLGRSRVEARMRARRALGSVGVEALIDRHPHQISGGQQQRAAIARALVNEPDLVLADEPTGALDDVNAERVLQLLLAIPRERGGAVVLVTHSAAVAERCDVHLDLRDGRIGRAGSSA